MNTPIYSMTVDLNVLDHLGINLYSNIAAVLTEAVANAWDADARQVSIDLDKGHGVITIVDDGHGMSIEDVNEKYLHIGYRRRTGGADTTPKGRPVMGRKGLGKLSLFSIADIIEVRSAKGKKAHGLRLVVSDIRKAVSANKMSYDPVVLPPNEVNITRGTSIVLKNITRPKVFDSIPVLRTQLARRFSVIGKAFKFKVSVNGQEITVADREELTKAQFVWQIGDAKLALPPGCDIKENRNLAPPQGAGCVRYGAGLRPRTIRRTCQRPRGT